MLLPVARLPIEGRVPGNRQGKGARLARPEATKTFGVNVADARVRAIQEFWKGAMADQLADDIISKIKGHVGPEIGDISPDTELTSLGIHSLELTEIIFDLEEDYGIEIEMNTVDAWSNLKTVHDMVAAVRALIEKKA